ncbi:ABC multidrug transporter-like protein [Amniculicola lignicola CBS 123094]|uniref:ABC multidrug transporter-like protein n=1 Tax=Amniculicola lignicola CBS 123094 TaxID=1392246 RepID=A0A6A5WFA3_9PLEO|nr:ABC multidrug transporter-like protein [Amniculicola lignicola CBS 123094]
MEGRHGSISVIHATLPAGAGDTIYRTLTGRSSRRNSVNDDRELDTTSDDEDGSSIKTKVDAWRLDAAVKEIQLNDQAESRHLGVTWKNLNVKVVPSDSRLQENVLSQFNIPQQFKESRHKPAMKSILVDSYGCVKPGEMLLVLGRPGSGCTTLLKLLANKRKGYTEVSGDVHYGALDAKQAQPYRGYITMNTEEELFYPTLTVGETMDFAARLNIPNTLPRDANSQEHFRQNMKSFLMDSMGISHTEDTRVGDAFVRGVSGGERKRVSIIEAMCARGSVMCWDNSTRGLDASTALEYTRALRSLTDAMGTATIVTLYQAGNAIYNLFDKVLVLDEGRQVFYGPREHARPFMEAQGFVCGDGANVADYLTGVTVPKERKIMPGFESRFPRNNLDLEQAYRQSSIKTIMDRELDYPTTEEAKSNTRTFCEAVTLDKSRWLPKSSPMTVSFQDQVKTCVIRQYQIIWGDKPTFVIKQGAALVQALVAGSLFYNAPNNSAGLFIKGGSLFLLLLYNSLMAMSEVTDSFAGRPILAKHKNFAFYNPAAFCIAQITADIPILFFQVTIFVVVLYWMTALKATAAAFFTCWFVVYLVTLVMTAFFRMVGAAFPNFDAASKVSGFSVTAFIVYIGYQIAKPEMHPWFIWIYWINPLSYGFESLMANEFSGRTIPCAFSNLIPNYLPQYLDSAHQACSGVRGALSGATEVRGEDYLQSLSYSASHIWRNVGILFAWWALYVGLTIFFTLRWDDAAGSTGALLIPRELRKKVKFGPADEETQIDEKGPRPGANDQSDDLPASQEAPGTSLMSNTSIFTWKNLSYVVKTPTGNRTLLDNVHGYVKPGMLGALMGSSGAGKTTLLDVLAQRKTDGTINGSILVDGRPLPVSFQRSAGYCEQLDVHEPYATVRESLEFSALLRQSRETPREQKLAYVDTIIDLLELHDIEHTLIGKLGAGLSVEQRKRVTIGVELVSKPSILIFLDEPTSGLDGQAAFNTVSFLRKLADAGQAVLVTIHQPSAQLFAQFDTLLLLAKGGKMVYFGDIGDNANTIKDYFGRHGAPCPTSANPAEHMIDVVTGTHHGRDWHETWLQSPEAARMHEDLELLITTAADKEPGTTDDGHEFATDLWTQIKLVTHRDNVSLFRDIDYVNNKFALHIGVALFIGFSFWRIGDSVTDQQLVLFALFNYIFVAAGVLAQLQPLFIARRDLYETREKKSKMYSWIAFVAGLVVSEMPYLVLCGTIYFLCFYFTAGLSAAPKHAGATFFVMLVYQFIYTGMGQFIAAYAPNAVFASLVNPLVIGTLVSFCGVLVPYAQIQAFWRYWIYYLNPFNYLMGSLLVFTEWDNEINCKESEFAIFDPPTGETCAEYLGAWLEGPGSRNNLVNPNAMDQCKVCVYRTGKDYLYTMNLTEHGDGWRDAAICVIFALSSYALVFLLMKLRTKASKKAE